MTPAEELKAAAECVRDLASAATPGPWQITDQSWVTSGIALVGSIGEPIADCGEGVAAKDEAAYIALWHPGTALLIADLLDGMAAHWDTRPVGDLHLYLSTPLCKLARHILGGTQ